MKASLSERTANAYAKSLKINANPDLRDLLTEIYVTGKATDEQIKAIPLFTGRMSRQEQSAIEETMGEVEQLRGSEELHKFLSGALNERLAHTTRWNTVGAANDKATKVGVAVSAIVSLLGITAGLLTGHPEVSLSSGGAGAFAATLATTYGFSRAGVIDEAIAGYGVHD